MRIQLFNKNQWRIQENNARLCCEKNLLGSLKLQIFELQDVEHKYYAPMFKVAFALEHSPAQGSKKVPSNSLGQVPVDALTAQVG